jgi:hypothetical protein
MNSDNIELEITIDEKGNITYSVNGLKGKGCTEATEFLDNALGEVIKREFKRDFYEQERKGLNRVTSRI